jgi:DNA-binding NtrC family response regulator
MKSRPHVLLVDDNVGMVETLSDIIEAAGMAVDTAGDAASAERLLAERCYDVAVLDIVLPDIDGVALMKRCRALCPGTKLVIITAYTNSELIDVARRDKVDDILYKPLEPERLLGSLRRLAGA